MGRPRRVETVLWLGALGFAIAIQMACWIAMPRNQVGSDPGAYSLIAWDLSRGVYPPEGVTGGMAIFAHRLGVVAPMAVFYQLFGVSIATYSLWPLLATVVTTVLVGLATPRGVARVTAVLLYALTPTTFYYTLWPFPDPIVAMFMFASLLLLTRRTLAEQPGREGRSALLAAGAMGLAFCAFLAKLSAWWLALFWLGLMAMDAWRGRRRTLLGFHAPAIAVGLVLGLGYLLFCHWVWGSPLARLTAINAVGGEHAWSTVKQPEALWARLTWEPWLGLSRILFPAFPLGLVGLLIARRRASGIAAFTIVVLGLAIWGPTSLRTYDPLPLLRDFRHNLPLVPPLCVMGGLAVARVFEAARSGRVTSRAAAAACASALVLGWGLWGHAEDQTGLYVALAMVGLMATAAVTVLSQPGRRATTARIGLALTALPLLAVPGLTAMRDHADNPAPSQRAAEAVINAIERADGPVLLLTGDWRLPSDLAFYFGYDPPRRLRVEYIAQIDPANVAPDAYEAVLFLMDQPQLGRLIALYDSPSPEASIQAWTNGETWTTRRTLYTQAGISVLELAPRSPAAPQPALTTPHHRASP